MIETCKGCGDWLWSPDIVLQAQNQLCKPDKYNTITHILRLVTNKQLKVPIANKKEKTVERKTGPANSK